MLLAERVREYFDFAAHQTDFRRETVAGLTTFITMSYILVVNPAILKAAGIPPEPSMVATVLTAVFGTLLMGLYARRPFAIAPYMGENAFVAYTVVGVLGYPWQTALGAVFIAGVLFVLLTAVRVRQWLVEAVPPALRYSFAVGIGLFLTFIGLNETGLVVLGSPGRAGANRERRLGGGPVGGVRFPPDGVVDDSARARRHPARRPQDDSDGVRRRRGCGACGVGFGPAQPGGDFS